MPYALQNMLKIRIKREDKASAELSAARQEVRRARQQLEERINELHDFEKTCEERRENIYKAILGHTVSREDIDLALEGVGRIDKEGVLKTDNVAMATGILHDKEELAEKARQNFVTASKERMKISEHRAAWEAEENAIQEHRQESELEDFTGKKNMEAANAE